MADRSTLTLTWKNIQTVLTWNSSQADWDPESSPSLFLSSKSWTISLDGQQGLHRSWSSPCCAIRNWCEQIRLFAGQYDSFFAHNSGAQHLQKQSRRILLILGWQPCSEQHKWSYFTNFLKKAFHQVFKCFTGKQHFFFKHKPATLAVQKSTFHKWPYAAAPRKGRSRPPQPVCRCIPLRWLGVIFLVHKVSEELRQENTTYSIHIIKLYCKNTHIMYSNDMILIIDRWHH